MHNPRNKKPCFVVLSLLASLNALAGEQVAKVIAVSGKATAGARDLSRASAIYQGETVSTLAGGKVKFKFTDGSIIALAEKSSYVIKNYSFNKANTQNTFESELLKGGLKTITGKIGKEAKRKEEAIAAGVPADMRTTQSNYKMQAGVASIGVRGTTGKVALVDGLQPLFGLGIFEKPRTQYEQSISSHEETAIVCTNGTFEVTDVQGQKTLVGELGDTNYLVVTELGSTYQSSDPIIGLDTQPDDDGGDEDLEGDEDLGDEVGRVGSGEASDEVSDEASDNPDAGN